MTDKASPPRKRRRFLHAIGIQRGANERLRLRFRFFVLGILLLLLVGLGTLTMYSTSPSFCRSCHIMEPYYQAWISSEHKDVACVDCHYPPGSTRSLIWHKFQALSQVVKYVTRTYSSKPYAEVEDASCLRSGCHATRLLRGRVVTEGGVLFDHRPHLEGVRYGRQLRCVSCHSQVVVGRHIEVTYETCYYCHLMGRQEGRHIEVLGGCLGCHTLPDRDITSGGVTYNHKTFLGQADVDCEACHQDVLQGDGHVPKDRCMMCHNQQDRLEVYEHRHEEEQFIHANHVTEHNTACFHCHTQLRHGTARAGTKELTLDCGTCHPETTTHDVERMLYRGLGAQGLDPMPSPMYLANVDCIGCHVEEKQVNGHTRSFLGSERGCTVCHGEGYVGMLSATHELMKEALDGVGQKLADVRSGLPEDAGAAARQGVDDVAHNLEFLREAHAVHNPYFAARILQAAETRLAAIGKEHGIRSHDASELPIITGAFCATICHERIGVAVPPETVEHDGKTMPHLEHTEMDLGCTYCHVFGRHKEVSLLEPAPCTECHDE
jgi:hypothetical protein